jgi:hypothetical protein
MRSLEATNPNELSNAEAAKLAGLKEKFEAARKLQMANKEADERASRVAAATGDTAPRPGAVDDALAGLGVAPGAEEDSHSSSESESEEAPSFTAGADDSTESAAEGNYQRA